jgi:DNA-binding response OmpR family regulator
LVCTASAGSELTNMSNADTKILVVDDEQSIRLLLRTSLESDGFFVTEAASGEEAICAIEQQKPVLVLLDLWMPQSDGMAVLEYLNRKSPEQRPRVIVLTANSRVPVVVKAMRLGASDFLEKPTTPEDLRISIAAALEEITDAAGQEVPAVEAPRAGEKLSAVLAEIRHAVWNQDIHFTEHALSVLFRKAWLDPAWFNLFGAVFEAEGNRGAARTFYEKAANAPAGCKAAQQNLLRLEMPDKSAGAEVDLGDQKAFLDEICAQRDGFHHEPHHSEPAHLIRSHT